MFDIKYVVNPKELFYTPDAKNLPVRRYHTSRPISYKATHIETPQMKIDVQSMIASNWFDEESHETDLPFLPQEILKLIHNFGYSMLQDDKHDIGKFAYTNRPGYPDHASGIHHWYIGAAMMTLAQIGGMIQKVKEFAEVGATMGLNELSSLSSTEEPPLTATQVKQPLVLPLYGNAPDTYQAIPYKNQVQQHISGQIPYQALRSTPQLSNNTITRQPQLPAPTKSIVPNPLRGLVNRS